MLISICSAPEGHEIVYVSDPKEVIENEGSLADLCGDHWKEQVVAFGLTGADILVPIIVDADGKLVEAPQTVDGDEESYGGIYVGITSPDDDYVIVDQWVKSFFFGLVADMVRNPGTTPDAKRVAEEAIKEQEPEDEKETTSEFEY